MNSTIEALRSRLRETGANVAPISRDFLPDLETPITALLRLRRPRSSNGTDSAAPSRTFLLESAEVGEKLARFSFLGRDPLYVFRARGRNIEISGRENRAFEGDALVEFRAFLDRFRGVEDSELPAFSGGAVGFFAYDSIRLLEKIPEQGRDDYGLNDLDFGIYEAFVVFDHLKHRLRLVANVMPDEHGGLEAAYARALSLLDGLEKDLWADLQAPAPHAPTLTSGATAPSLVWTPNMAPEEYLAGVESCKEYIRAGDAFQIVLSQRFQAKIQADAISIYRRLRAINPSPYMYYLDYGDFEVVGASPETLVKVQGGVAETKPAAGTRPRGKDDAEDQALREELLQDPKEIAEHVMLVDLGRNDLGRVSAYGSVSVPRFMQIDGLSHVMHIVSLVRGTLRSDAHALDALMSCLPAGTLSGAPKIRAMEIIDALEPTRRGIYGGAVCYLDFRGNLDSCIAIRTLTLKDGVAYAQAGAGIVADSVPESEYQETRHKARAAMLAVEAAEADFDARHAVVGNGGKKA